MPDAFAVADFADFAVAAVFFLASVVFDVLVAFDVFFAVVLFSGEVAIIPLSILN